MKGFNAEARVLLARILATESSAMVSVYMSTEAWWDFQYLLLEEGFVEDEDNQFHKVMSANDVDEKHIHISHCIGSEGLYWSVKDSTHQHERLPI